MSGDEWLTAERKHELEMAKVKADTAEAERRHRRDIAEQRTERVGYVMAGLTIAAIILGIAWFFWQSSGEKRAVQERIELACIERGGSWTNLGGTSSAKSCYQIGTVEEAN